MVQDSELPKNDNLNTKTNTNLDGKKNENKLPEDSNKTDMITANDRNINDNNKDTYIQNSNETSIDEYETVQDSTNPDPNNDSTNTSTTHDVKESSANGLNDTDEAKEDSNNDNNNNNDDDDDNDNNNVNDPADDDLADDDPEYTNPEEEQNSKLRAIQSVGKNQKEKKINKRSSKGWIKIISP